MVALAIDRGGMDATRLDEGGASEGRHRSRQDTEVENSHFNMFVTDEDARAA
jgi:hypothetical protein